MHLSKPIVVIALLALFAGPFATPAAAGERTVLKTEDVLAHGLAKSSLRGYRLFSGTAYLRPSGKMSATLTLHGKHARVLVPYESHVVGRDGTYLGSGTFDDAGFKASSKQFGLGVAAPAVRPDDTERFEPAAGRGSQQRVPPTPLSEGARPSVSAARVQRINQQIATLEQLSLAAGFAGLEVMSHSLERWTPGAERARERAYVILDRVDDGWQVLLSLLPREAGLTPDQVAQRDIPQVRASVQATLRLGDELARLGR